MLFDSVGYRAMESSLNALWMQQQVASHNLANYDTPGYKARSVAFEDVLRATPLDRRQGRYAFRANVTQETGTDQRIDGNNVDVETESLKLFQTYAQSSFIYQKIGAEYSNLRYVLSQSSFK